MSYDWDVPKYLTEARLWCIICGADLESLNPDEIEQHIKECFVTWKQRLFDADS